MESHAGAVKEVKTYSRISKTIKNYHSAPKLHIAETLSSKDAAKFFLEGTLRLRVCRYCLNVASDLSELDEILVLAGKCGLYEVTIKDIIASFHAVRVTYDVNIPNKICKPCLDKALQCYLFTQQCEQAERAILNYFEDINEKFYKLDPLDPIKKRGKPKLNPNHNVLHTEFKNVIDYAEPIMNLINLNALPMETESNDLECPKCWQVLPNQTSLINHEKSHPKSMWYHCKQCGKSFIKYNQLKKHKRQAHIVQDLENKTDMVFTCKHCGIMNNKLTEHLMHIEKHKFRQILNDLIMKPQGNCAICFSRDSNMMNLNETMHFHGGIPGLVGEKHIYNIVSSVFPEQSCKYWELFTPTLASLLHIRKRKTEKLDVPIKKIKYSLEHAELHNINTVNVKKYLFSKPDKIKFIFTKFKRSDPEYLNEIKENPIKVTIEKANGSDNFNAQMLKGIVCLKKNTIKDDLNSTENLKKDFVTEIIDNKAGDTFKSCKVCWIFKKPTCASCKNSINTPLENIANKIHENKQESNERCDYCYVFSKITLHNYPGNKICKQCVNKLVTSYIFKLSIQNNRNRLDKCIRVMIDTLENVDDNKNILIEISHDAILPAINERESFVNDDPREEFLEDEFRLSETESDSDNESDYSSFEDVVIENPAKNVTKTYGKKVLVNGYQQCVKSKHLDEFLKFKKHRKYKICRYTCPMCSKHFISDYFLKKHIIRHITQPTQCKGCSKMFKSRFYLTEHLKTGHILNSEQNSCSACGRFFKTSKNLEKHTKTHNIKECQLCDKFFKSQKHFNTHFQRHAVKFNVNRYNAQICSFCEKACSNENELSLHVNKVHLQMKPYSCDMCEKQFYTEYNLNSHKKLHNLKSKEPCCFCHKILNSRKTLVVHLRKHINIKPHYCPVCSKSFYSETSMKCHMKIYHGGRYCCRLCRQVVDSNGDLKNHLKVAHSCM